MGPQGSSSFKGSQIVKDREAWPAAAQGVAKSRTRLSDWTTGVSNVAKIGSPPTLHMCWSAFSVSATSPPSSGVQGGALL